VTSARRPASDNDEAALRTLLERSVADLCGSREAIAGVGRARSASASSYAAEIVTVELASGDTLRFFLKDLGTTCIPKDQPQQRRERELAIYRDVLSAADLGTARYFGSVWEPARGCFWLLLELVSGCPVRQCTFDAWLAAAAWLGRLQGFVARHSERVAAGDLLLRYDAEFLWSQAELAARHVVGISIPLAKQLKASLERYERAVPTMVGWPPTLVHGHYRPYNVLVDGTLELPRVCPVDWERAGFGPPAYDFAYLAEGFDPQRLDLLGEAYHAEAARHGLSIPNPEELRFLANAFRVHRMLSLLGSAVDRRFTDAEVSKLVTLVSHLCDSL
jgi:hypothetical protein